MSKIIKTATGIIKSDFFKNYISEIMKSAVETLLMDPVSAIELTNNMLNMPSTVRDGIFIECLQVFILNSAEYDVEKQCFVNETLDSFVQALAEVSPNKEADYKGDPGRLLEYAKRIIKMIDDCGTISKAFYIACLARAVRAKSIDSNKFFKLCNCVRNLTEEDLLFLNNHISKEVVTDDEDYIDDFRAMGLMKEVEGGFIYTKRAYELKKYALDYEGQVAIPDSFMERSMSHTAITSEKIDDIANKAAEKATLRWGKI